MSSHIFIAYATQTWLDDIVYIHIQDNMTLLQCHHFSPIRETVKMLFSFIMNYEVLPDCKQFGCQKNGTYTPKSFKNGDS